MVHSNKIKSKNAISLVKCFKKQEKAFIKFIKTVGRKNFYCQCHLIDKDNNKWILDLTLLDINLKIQNVEYIVYILSLNL